MRESSFLLSLAAAFVIAFSVVAGIFLSPEFAHAADRAADANDSGRAPEGCPCNRTKSNKPKFADLKPQSDGQPLDDGDEVAALSSVQHALSNTGDGANYVWRRQNGRISGIVKPTSSFKNAEGEVCRHIIVMLTTGNKTRKTEGIACRKSGGVWSLEG